MKKQTKRETVEEFLARGGKITKCSYKEPELKNKVISTSNAGPAVILTLSEADLFFGETKVKKKAAKPVAKVDINMLPEALKTKFLSRALEEVGHNEEKENN
jgi:hypothetical protein